MRYANQLSNAVVESGWTYQKIIEKCKLKGVSFSRSYLSKICTGALPPPSDEINKVLADVLSLKYEKLAVSKYKEIIPTEVLAAIASGE
jgi:transcriptional regulator with XRE-family HTH domain